ncbi:UvrD-helicase domain-containing protein [Sphaerotilus microaerophilus]|uniref:DNA 3'-5' helicase n=1 Tax=Sphaerotilus microaerophilus TaxID=2914710 RepID=A0ABM7YQB1_9BURK|nr:UvrD-helicase domain-containing protein [Sphaerotilus sp. FB-5]BDI06735.1 hypothetical protein CATMQ487_37050 [Sphaerotilus sp. FB-5]
MRGGSNAIAAIAATDEQRAILRSDAARLLIEANAGTGKTTTLCMRALDMVHSGADPARILMLSYTAPGSLAIARAFERLGAPARLRKAFRIGSFDALCSARLKVFEGGETRALEHPEDLRAAVLAAVVTAREAAEARHPGAFTLRGGGELAVESLLRAFEHLKGTLALHQRQAEGWRLTPASAADTGHDYTTLAVFMAYERYRLVQITPDGERVRFRYTGDATYDLACLLDADDPAYTLETHPLCMGELHGLFVDEFHDMNRAMATVLKELLAQYPQLPLAAVGDVDQVIHAASGAQSWFLREGFDLEFGRAERFPLTQARRFGPAVADALGRFAAKPYPADRARRSTLRSVVCDGAIELTVHLRELLAQRAQAVPPRPAAGVAVLLRHPHAALDLEYLLLRYHVDYSTVGFTTYAARPELLFVRMVLAAAAEDEQAFTPTSLSAAKAATWAFIGGALPRDGADDPETATTIAAAPAGNFQRHLLPVLLERTERHDSARCIARAIALLREGGVAQLHAALRHLPVRELAAQVYVQAEDVRNAVDSVQALLRVVDTDRPASIAELLRVIRTQEERRESAAAQGASGLLLSTIEQAKGLEYDHVVIPGLGRGEFDGDDADERNLFYVAVSRGRDTVELVHGRGPVSRFVPAG